MRKLLFVLTFLPFVSFAQYDSDIQPFPNLGMSKIQILDSVHYNFMVIDGVDSVCVKFVNGRMVAVECDTTGGGGTTYYAGQNITIVNDTINATGSGSVANADSLAGQPASYYLNRQNHINFQAISTVTGLQTALDSKLNETDTTAMLSAYWRKSDGYDSINAVREDFQVIVKPEQFGAVGDGVTDDTDAWNSAVTAAGDNGVVQGRPKAVYKLTGNIDLNNIQGLKIDGMGATLKRCAGNEVLTTLASLYTFGSGNTTFTVDSVPSTWNVGDHLYMVGNGVGADSVTVSARRITDITGTTITIHSGFLAYNGATHPVGGKVLKSFPLISGQFSSTSSINGAGGANKNTKITNLKFDGNRSNNTITHYWAANTGVELYGRGSSISYCEFFDMPNECLVTQGVDVIYNYFHELNGSAVHTSVNDETFELNTPCKIIGNNIYNVNNTTFEVSGHNEGAITFSWGAGNLIVSGNYFRASDSTNNAVFGSIGPATGANPDSSFIFTGNQAYGFNKIFYDIYSTTKNITVSGNIFSDCGTNDFSSLQSNPTIQIGNNILTNGTSVTIENFNDLQKFTQVRRDMFWQPDSMIFGSTYTHSYKGFFVISNTAVPSLSVANTYSDLIIGRGSGAAGITIAGLDNLTQGLRYSSPSAGQFGYFIMSGSYNSNWFDHICNKAGFGQRFYVSNAQLALTLNSDKRALVDTTVAINRNDQLIHLKYFNENSSKVDSIKYTSSDSLVLYQGADSLKVHITTPDIQKVMDVGSEFAVAKLVRIRTTGANDISIQSGGDLDMRSSGGSTYIAGLDSVLIEAPYFENTSFNDVPITNDRQFTHKKYVDNAIAAATVSDSLLISQDTVQLSASISLSTAHAGKLIVNNTTSNYTVDIGTGLNFKKGIQKIDFEPWNTGNIVLDCSAVTVKYRDAAGSTATVSATVTIIQGATLRQIGTDTYMLIGSFTE